MDDEQSILKVITDYEGNVVEKWFNPGEFTVSDQPASEGDFQISPFVPKERWDITSDLGITDYECVDGFCEDTGGKKPVDPFVVQQVQTGMRLAVLESSGTLHREQSFMNYPVPVAGKTGTAEYCDEYADARNLCAPGQWPSHAWTVAFAPYENPEIAVVAFVYNGNEGSTVAGPIVRRALEAYFELINGGYQSCAVKYTDNWTDVL